MHTAKDAAIVSSMNNEKYTLAATIALSYSLLDCWIDGCLSSHCGDYTPAFLGTTYTVPVREHYKSSYTVYPYWLMTRQNIL